MALNEVKVEAGWDAWNLARKSHSHGIVYGVVHGKDGDTVYSWGLNGSLERIVNHGYATRLCHQEDDAKIAKAMSDDRFAVVLGAHWDKSKLFRIYPELSDKWSKKSAHPMIGGLGTISAAMLPA